MRKFPGDPTGCVSGGEAHLCSPARLLCTWAPVFWRFAALTWQEVWPLLTAQSPNVCPACAHSDLASCPLLHGLWEVRAWARWHATVLRDALAWCEPVSAALSPGYLGAVRCWE